MSDPALTQIDDRELENMSVDAANFPYQKQRAMLYWNGSAWVKWDGALQAGTAALGSVNIRNTDGTDNSYTSGGVYGQKVHVVGDSDKYVEGTIAAGSSLTGHKPVAVGFKDASGNNQFAEGTTANGIEVDVTRIGAGTATIGSVKLTDGTDTATVATALDSRNGLDIQHSSVASKQLVYFHSDDATHNLLATESKLFPTDIPGGSAWFDLNGYLGFQCDWVDNSSGAGSASLYAIWSEDQTAYAENFPPGGNTQAIFTTVDNNVHKFVPRQGRYVQLKLINGSVDEGTVVPTIAILKLTAVPSYFTNSVNITSSNQTVVGPIDIPTYGYQPIINGGVDSTGIPTTAYAQAMTNTGQAAVTGTSAAFTGTALVSTQKLVTTSSQSAVTAGTTSSTLVASSTSRVGVIVYNHGQYPVHYRLSSSACTTAAGGYSGIIWPGCSVQLGTTYKPYSGSVTCITPTGTGNSSVSLSTI